MKYSNIESKAITLQKKNLSVFMNETELEAMTPEQKRLLVIQLKQVETMEWQKVAAQIQVYSFVFGIIIAALWIAFVFISNN